MFKVKPFPRHIPITIATYEQAKYDTNRNNLTSVSLKIKYTMLEWKNITQSLLFVPKPQYILLDHWICPL